MREQPSAVIVDDLDGLMDARHGGYADRRARECAVCGVLALLTDVVAHAGARHAAAAAAAAAPAAAPHAGGCQLLVSQRSGDGGEPPALLYITQRWLPLTLTCRTQSDMGGCFMLSRLPGESLIAPPTPPLRVRFSLSAAALVVQSAEQG
jgi:hypothetical protein